MSKLRLVALVGLVVTACVIYWVGAVSQAVMLFVLAYSAGVNMFAAVALVAAVYVQASVAWHHVSLFMVAKLKKFLSS